MNIDFIRFLLTVSSLLYGVLVYSAQSSSFEKDTFICSLSSNLLTVRHGYENEIVECLKTHRSAKGLELTESGLQYIPSYIEILKNLTVLNLSNNDLKTANFSTITTICSNLRIVVLDNNGIAALRRSDLDCLASVEKLSIANNSLTLIENGTFNEKQKRIDHICLIHNNLTEFDTSLLSRAKLSRNVSIRINASWNSIRLITNSIDLTIDNISNETTIGIAFLHNSLTNINVSYIGALFNITNNTQLQNLGNCGFDVRFNPWICNCAMLPFAKLLRRFKPLDPDNPVFSITCNTPQPLNGKVIREVPENQFNCSVTERCPQLCSCQETVALNLISVDCGSSYVDNDLPAEVPRSKHIRLMMSHSQLKKVSYRDFLSNTTEFDVSESDIIEVQSSALEALDAALRLKFDNNNFTYLPQAFKKLNFSNGKTLTLHGNPFICDCHSLWMKQWILKVKQNIKFYNKILCSGKPVVEVSDDQFVCPAKLPLWTTAVLIPCGALLITILLVATFALGKDSITVFLISRFSFLRKCFGNVTGLYKYDIFIPHSCLDDEQIYPIVKTLENGDPPCSVCLGEKHFPLGKTITENILNAIENSRTTLLMVSNNFLRSAWCNMEFREAHSRFLRDRKINMTVVLLEELDEKLLYNELQIYMKSHVYLEYSDSHFWDKLFGFLQTEVLESSPLIST